MKMATAKGIVNATVINVSTNVSVFMTVLLSPPLSPIFESSVTLLVDPFKRERDYRQNANDGYAIVQSQGLHKESPK
jgi:hypothetical protein